MKQSTLIASLVGIILLLAVALVFALRPRSTASTMAATNADAAALPPYKPGSLTLRITGTTPYAMVSYNVIGTDKTKNAEDTPSRVVPLPFTATLDGADKSGESCFIIAAGTYGALTYPLSPVRVELLRGEKVVASCDGESKQTTGNMFIVSLPPEPSGYQSPPESTPLGCQYFQDNRMFKSSKEMNDSRNAPKN